VSSSDNLGEALGKLLSTLDNVRHKTVNLHRKPYDVREAKEESMKRANHLLRCVLFGAVGFGIGGAVSGQLIMLLSGLVPGLVGLPLTLFVGGALGGAALGLALRDWRRVVVLALLGVLGLTVGVMAGLILGSFFNYAEVPTTVMVGAVVGTSLGAAFLDWRTILALAVAGAVGFGVGTLPADFVRFSIPILRQLGEAGSYAITGIIGGASLGAALGYLEQRKLAEERRPRVR
jgi:hypothetical protein